MRARGINGNEEVLTRRPYLSKQEANQIRSKSMCNGRTICVAGLSCDEYPPASTDEGYQGLFGIDVFSQCINARQNSGGGAVLGNLFGKGSNAIPAGSTFVSRVINLDCNTIAPANPGSTQSFPPKSKRQSDETTTNIIYPPLPGDPSGYALLPFGDLNAGTYTVVVTTSARIDSWEFYDAPALNMGSGDVIPPNTPITLQFSLDLRDYGVSMITYTTAEAIDIQWTITLTSLGNGTTTVPPSTASTSCSTALETTSPSPPTAETSSTTCTTSTSSSVEFMPSTTTSVEVQSSAISPSSPMNSTSSVGASTGISNSTSMPPPSFTGGTATSQLAFGWLSIYGFLLIGLLPGLLN